MPEAQIPTCLICGEPIQVSQPIISVVTAVVMQPKAILSTVAHLTCILAQLSEEMPECMQEKPWQRKRD